MEQENNLGIIKENGVIFYNGYLHFGDIKLVGDSFGPVAYQLKIRCRNGSAYSRQYLAFNEMPKEGNYCKCPFCFEKAM